MDTLKSWNLQKRKNLELMIERGLSLKEMSQTSGMSVHAIREELLRGLEGDDRTQRRYVRYLVEVSIKTIVNEAVGEDGLNCYLWQTFQAPITRMVVSLLVRGRGFWYVKV